MICSIPRPYSAVSSYFVFAQVRLFEFAEPYFGVATGNNCVESERGLMIDDIYNYLAIKNKHFF